MTLNQRALKYDPYSGTSNFLSWAETIIMAVFAVIFMFTFVFRIVAVKGRSMENTLHENDRLVISNWLYTPEPGDIIVANTSALDQVIIKRVIAVSNDEVEIDYKSGTVKVNGAVISEGYIAESMLDNGNSYGYNEETGTYRYKVPFGYVFVMGDNRNHSTDSRDIGPVPYDEIMGRVVYRFYSEKSSIGRVY